MVRELVSRYSRQSREGKWAIYQRLFPPRLGERILDIGASSHTELPWENWFLKRYPYPEQVTTVVIEGAAEVRAAFPGVKVVEGDGRSLPFDNDSFDIVHSNAVIEHVGSESDQRRFVAEALRVGNHTFLTTPDRWFPIETHSYLPVVHWLPQTVSWRIIDKAGKPWAKAWLLTPSTFRDLYPDKPRLYRQRIAGLTASLVAVT